MTGSEHTRGDRPGARGMRAVVLGLALGGAIGVLLGLAGPAYADWTTDGDGVGTATVDTLAPSASVVISTFGSTVTVNWAAVTPPQGTLDGYTVTRFAGSTPSNACGTDPTDSATFIPAGTTTCADSLVPDGTYSYTVTAYFRTWTAESAQSNADTVVADETKPTQSVTLAPGASNAFIVGTTLYYRSTVGGSFQLLDKVTGVTSNPASATFPAIGATSWTHAAETVSTGTGSNPTITYTSSTYSWTTSPASPAVQTITGRDVLAQTVSTPLSFASDTTGPTGGVLTVNAVVASGAGTTSSARATFSIGARTDYTADAGAGLASSVLTREPATLINNTCGSFGSATVLTGAPSQSGLTTGCYRYTLTGTDNVGNTTSISTTVQYDVGLPTQAITMNSGVNASQTGNTIYYRNTVAGSFALSDAVTDNDSGPASTTYPVIGTAGWTHPVQTVSSGTGSVPTIAYASSTYSFAIGANNAASTSVVGKDVAGNSVTTVMALTKDIVSPVSGKLTVNGLAASAAGTTSFDKTSSATISIRTDWTDAASGIASSILTVASASLSANTCGTFGAPSTIVGSPTQTGLTTGCYKFTLAGTDKVGNVIAPFVTTVKVDLVPPSGGALTVNGLAAATVATTSLSNNPTSFPIDVHTDYSVDAESGMKTSVLTRALATTWVGGVCGAAYNTAVTIVGNPDQTGLTSGCYKYILTGTDNALNAPTITTIVKYDLVAPTAGALTVNGTVATAAGTSSTATSAPFTIGVRTANTDAHSGLASTILGRQFATLTGTTCGSFGAPTTIVGSPSQTGLATGCYLYTLTGTDNAGNTVAISTTVQLGVYVTAVALTNGTLIAGRTDIGDKIAITFSDQIDVSTLCSAWSNSAVDQTINGDNQVTVTLTNGGAGNDSISVTSSVCALNFGALALGATTYTNATVTFGGAGANKSIVDWSASGQKLTITLGAVSGAGPATVNTAVATYTPSTAVLNLSAMPVGSFFALPTAKQF